MNMMNIIRATREFEKWVGRHTPIVRSQLTQKHKMMAEDPCEFLRGTFYRWAQVWPEVCPDLAKAPVVLAVADLHVSSFGTWRDAFGRLVWGVDDFDEAYPMAYANDLVRLAASAVIDASDKPLPLSLKNVCDVVRTGYEDGLKAGGRPFVLEEKHKWLREVALNRLDVPAVFWKKMDELAAVKTDIPRDARTALERMLPDSRPPYRIVRRIAGVGSLGHARYVAIAEVDGGQIAFEAKAAVPSACAWSRPAGSAGILYEKALKRAVRSPDPYVRLDGDWLMRRLAPDSSPIEIETLKGRRSDDRLLHAMAWEAANVHLGTQGALPRVLKDLKARPGKWLRSGVRDMSDAVMKDWKDWKKAH